MVEKKGFFNIYYKSKYHHYKQTFILIPFILFCVVITIFLSIQGLNYFKFCKIDNHIKMRTIDIFCKYDDIKQIENMYSNAIISSYRLYTPIEAENNVFEKIH